jgi:xanthine dehydrogenase YagR molybdenum-binding subunit
MSDRNAIVGRPLDRIDGPAKTCGTARYAAEFSPSNLAYGVIVQSTVPAGKVRLDISAAKAMPGVVFILTHDNAPELPQKGRAAVNPPAGRVLSLLQDDDVHYNGEPIAVVVADTFEIATEAASRIRADYAALPQSSASSRRSLSRTSRRNWCVTSPTSRGATSRPASATRRFA